VNIWTHKICNIKEIALGFPKRYIFLVKTFCNKSPYIAPKLYQTDQLYMEKVLEINHLTKRFGRLTAVDNLSFSVEKGNVYGLLGPNGSGKSTTLGMILQVVNATSGQWKWFGEEPHTESLKRVGAIIERPNFYPYLTAQQNLEIVATIKEVSFDQIDKKLALVGLLERKNHAFRTYSLGMKQRLAIAAAMLNDPEVLILDEPTNGLDPQGIIQIREIIQAIAAKGTTIILASHLLDEVEKVCSHVVVLQSGKTIYSSKGRFEIASKDMIALQEALLQMPYFSTIQEHQGKFLSAKIEEDIEADHLNALLFEKGIVVKHLVKKQESLESQFFQLIKKQND
jgi:ABC-type multidrug transport system ATPase subunit